MKQLLLYVACITLLSSFIPQQALSASTNSSGPWGIDAGGFRNLSTALASPATAGKTIVITRPMDCNTVTVSAGRSIDFKNDGRITVPAGKTFTYSGDTANWPERQLFTGAGTVTFGTAPGLVPKVWFGPGVSTNASIGLMLPKILSITAPTLVVNAAAGNLNGTIYYGISFVTAYGETDIGPESASVSPVNQQVDLSNIPVSPDPAVIARKIYRTPAGATDTVVKKLVATIANNTVTTYTDNIAEGSLGANAPYINTTGGNIYATGGRLFSFGSSSLGLGWGAMPNNTGYANTAVGTNSLLVNTSGYRNVGVGVFSLAGNTTGYYNSGVGVHALNYNTTGNSNTGVGYYTLFAATTANNNTAVGSVALSNTTSGNSNTAIGTGSMSNLAVGSENTMVGSDTGYHNFAATSNFSRNTALGSYALYKAAGDGNVAIGYRAGAYETGSDKLYIDNQERWSEADAKGTSLIYGEFNANQTLAKLRINGKIEAPLLGAYADNAAAVAAGVPVGTIYRATGGNAAYPVGVLMLVY